jgi:hypothetical protein
MFAARAMGGVGTLVDVKFFSAPKVKVVCFGGTGAAPLAVASSFVGVVVVQFGLIGRPLRVRMPNNVSRLPVDSTYNR